MTDPNAKTSPKRVKTSERRRQAVNLRIGGKTYEDIGKLLGVTKQAVAQMIRVALADISTQTAESAEELRRLEMERLDFIRSAIWKQVVQGDLQAVDRAIKISKRVSELTGIDAPTKTENKNEGESEVRVIWQVAEKRIEDAQSQD